MKNIIITGKNFKLTSSLKDYVMKKMGKLNEFSSLRIIEAKVELDFDHNQKSGLINRIEASVQIPGHIFKAGQKAEHMREAIDLCLPKLFEQISKFKDKILTKKKGHHLS